MALGIGYNVKKAEELMGSIATAYTTLGTTITEQWPTVSNVLRTNWVGEDELNYEENVVKRINEMYKNAYVLSSIAIGTIDGLARGWWDFQKKNVFSNQGQLETMGQITLTTPTITENETLITFTTKTFAATDDRGLKDASSATTIKGQIDTFRSTVTSKMNALAEMDVASAFFGDQTQKIKTYLENLNKSMVNVALAIKDLYDCLDTMASSHYTTSQMTAASEFVSSEQTKVDQQVANVDTSARWTSE